MAISTAAGVRLYIGSDDTPDFTEDESAIITAYNTDYSTNGQLIGEVEDPGEFGDEVNPVTFTALSDRRVRKLKGSYDAGTMTMVLGFDGEDDGQQALNDALNDTSQADYNFRIEMSDAPSEEFTNTVFYFSGKVMSRRIQTGSADNVVRATVTIGINSPVFEIEPGTGSAPPPPSGTGTGS